jgi:hypothetical protein
MVVSIISALGGENNGSRAFSAGLWGKGRRIPVRGLRIIGEECHPSIRNIRNTGTGKGCQL